MMQTLKTELLEDLIRVSSDMGIPVLKLTRDAYRSQKTQPIPKVKWSLIKQEAEAHSKDQDGELDDSPASGETVNFDPDSGTVTYDAKGNLYDKRQIRTIQDLIDHCEIDTENGYVVTKQQTKSWTTTAFTKGADGERHPRPWQNFSVTLGLQRDVPRLELTTALGEIRRQSELSEFRFPRTPRYDDLEEDNILEIMLTDVHIGKIARFEENADSDQNLDAIEDRFRRALDKLLSRASKFEYNKVLFVLGNDYFNSDSLNNSTTSGTPQHEDADYRVTYRLGCSMALDGMDLIRKYRHVPTDIMMVPGNHDRQRAFYLGEHLDTTFRNDDWVNVINTDAARKYYKHGRVFLGFCHGNEERDDALPMLMATQGRHFGYDESVRFAEWHLGHLHKKRSTKHSVKIDKQDSMNEEFGINVRRISAITSSDSWHERKGFTGNVKAGEAFIWNAEEGLVANLNCCV